MLGLSSMALLKPIPKEQLVSRLQEPSGLKTCYQKFAILRPETIRTSLAKQDQAGSVAVTVKV